MRTETQNATEGSRYQVATRVPERFCDVRVVHAYARSCALLKRVWVMQSILRITRTKTMYEAALQGEFMNTTDDDVWLTADEVQQRYKLKTRAAVQQWAREGKFPKPVRLRWKVSRWRLSDIRAWENSRAAKTS